jgi:hypothetical protein
MIGKEFNMTVQNRTFENENSFEVTNRGSTVEFAVWNGNLHVTGEEEASWDSQRTNFVLTPTDATALKLFLEKQGF